jgi:putative spermidine/putrescine transport system permease protein
LKNSLKNISLIFFVIIGVVPFVAAFGYALLYSFGIVGVVNEGFTLEFWEAVLSSGEFFKSFFYSAAIALVSMVLSVSVSLWLTLKFKDELEGRFLSFITYLPLAIPGVVAAFFTFQLFSKSGFFSRLSYSFNWIEQAADFPDFVNDTYALGIILTFATMVIPFFVLLFLNVYKNERIADLSVLAQALGASKNQVVRRVYLPIMLQKTWVLIVLYFIFLLGSYEVPLILGQESPQMLSVLIIREIKQYDLTKISEGYVVAVIYTVIVSIAAIALFLPKKRMTRET